MAKRMAERNLENDTKKKCVRPKRMMHYLHAQPTATDFPFMYQLSNGGAVNQGDGALRGDAGSWFSYALLPNELHLSDGDFKSLWMEHPVEREEIFIYGKTIQSPRWTQSYGQDYFYSGRNHLGKPFLPLMERYLGWLNQTHYVKGFQNQFNMCLVNWYRDGDDYIAPHSDDEGVLEKNAAGETTVVTLSFGAHRTFRLLAKDPQDIRMVDYEVDTYHNSVLVMGGTCQRTHNHTIIKQRQPNPRISLTFRIFNVHK